MRERVSGGIDARETGSHGPAALCCADLSALLLHDARPRTGQGGELRSSSGIAGGAAGASVGGGWAGENTPANECREPAVGGAADCAGSASPGLELPGEGLPSQGVWGSRRDGSERLSSKCAREALSVNPPAGRPQEIRSDGLFTM